MNNGWVIIAGYWKRGNCTLQTKTIRIPVWAIERDTMFAVHYLNHEVAHALVWEEKHSVKWLMKLTEICSCGRCPENEKDYKPKTVAIHNNAFGGSQ